MKAIMALALLACSTVAFSSNKCYIEKDPQVPVTMWTNIHSNKPTIEGYMYENTPFIGNCESKINGYCLAVDEKGVTYSFFKELQVKTIPMKHCQ